MHDFGPEWQLTVGICEKGISLGCTNVQQSAYAEKRANIIKIHVNILKAEVNIFSINYYMQFYLNYNEPHSNRICIKDEHCYK